MDPIQAYEGIRPIFKGIWFAHGAPGGPPLPYGEWPVTPAELSGSLGQPAATTTPVMTWPGHTALVLGPSSWGVGIGPWGSTAEVVPRALPTHVTPGL